MESIWIITTAVLLIIILGTINDLRSEIAGIKFTLEKMAKEMGIDYMAIENIDEELKALIKKGKKIKAVKRYRMVTGLGLKECKEYVDSLVE